MKDQRKQKTEIDKGGTRYGVERRKFSYSAFLPERRGSRDRRSGYDRRRYRYRSS